MLRALDAALRRRRHPAARPRRRPPGRRAGGRLSATSPGTGSTATTRRRAARRRRSARSTGAPAAPSGCRWPAGSRPSPSRRPALRRPARPARAGRYARPARPARRAAGAGVVWRLRRGGHRPRRAQPHRRLDAARQRQRAVRPRPRAARAGRGARRRSSRSTSRRCTRRACATKTSSPPSDVVVTKPGYGIISECLANDTALLYTDRGHFIEYDVLVARDAALRALRLPAAGRAPARPLARRARRGCWRRRRPARRRRPTAPPWPPMDRRAAATDGGATASPVYCAVRLTR